MSANSLSVSNAEAGHKAVPALKATIQSTLQFTLVLFPVSFMLLLLHEGGHALMNLALGSKVEVFYAHPFALDGYVRPFAAVENVWEDAAGNILAHLMSFLIFILFWKHRSMKTLPLVMLFPMSALRAGFDVMNLANGGGDYNNIVRLTGFSTTPFHVLNSTLAVVGIFLFISTFPLLGLRPKQLRALFVIPAGLVLWGLVGVAVAYLIVPGSPIDVRYHLGESLINGSKVYPTYGWIIGLLLAGLYFTLYRWIESKLPASLRTEVVTLSWKDLGLPAVLAAASSAIGLFFITQTL